MYKYYVPPVVAHYTCILYLAFLLNNMALPHYVKYENPGVHRAYGAWMVNAGLSECKAHAAWTPGGGISSPGPPGCAYSGPLLNGLWAALITTPPGAKGAGKEPTNGLAWQRVRGSGEKKGFVRRPLKTGRSWPARPCCLSLYSL